MYRDSNFKVADDIRTKDKIESLKDQVLLGIEKATVKCLELEKRK
jgi:hypothetical protein